VRAITGLIVGRVADRLRQERDIELEVDEALVARLATDGFDAEFGARPLQRHVRRTLEKELTRAILDGRLTDGDRVRAAQGDDGTIVLDVRQPAALLGAAA
jgi:ATP-dependent Clp protease ATP-binding subunit ClpC